MPTHERGAPDMVPWRADLRSPESGGEELFRRFAQDLAGLLERLVGVAPAPRASGPADPAPADERVGDELRALRQEWSEWWERRLLPAIRDVEAKVDALAERCVSVPSPAAPVPPPLPPLPAPLPAGGPSSRRSAGEELERVLLGEQLAADTTFADARQALVAGVVSREREACVLAGFLLLFQSVAVERLPQILKDLGEAFYQWHPKPAGREPDGFEAALVAWLNTRCAEAQIPNYVEVVQPGDRFDHLLHNAEQGGNEVLEVAGWIVARRGSDRPFAKARVTAR